MRKTWAEYSSPPPVPLPHWGVTVHFQNARHSIFKNQSPTFLSGGGELHSGPPSKKFGSGWAIFSHSWPISLRGGVWSRRGKKPVSQPWGAGDPGRGGEGAAVEDGVAEAGGDVGHAEHRRQPNAPQADERLRARHHAARRVAHLHHRLRWMRDHGAGVRGWGAAGCTSPTPGVMSILKKKTRNCRHFTEAKLSLFTREGRSFQKVQNGSKVQNPQTLTISSKNKKQQKQRLPGDGM